MLIKCICTNCAGHLEFDDANVGTTIKCPHCGFDTKLFNREAPSEEGESGGNAGNRRKLPRWAIGLGVAVLVLAGIGYALYEWGLSLVDPFLPGAAGVPVSVAALVLLCLVFLWILVWTIWPICFLFEVRKISRLLSEIKQNNESASETEENDLSRIHAIEQERTEKTES